VRNVVETRNFQALQKYAVLGVWIAHSTVHGIGTEKCCALDRVSAKQSTGEEFNTEAHRPQSKA
jgi:hypothetical protein